jgi:hypothetical protein
VRTKLKKNPFFDPDADKFEDSNNVSEGFGNNSSPVSPNKNIHRIREHWKTKRLKTLTKSESHEIGV